MTISEQIASDLEEVFNDGLTVDAVHGYGESSTETLKVFFDHPYDSTEIFNAGAENAQTRIQVQTADMTNVTSASTFTIGGVTYYVSEIYDDKEGVTQIAISEANVQ